MILKFENVTHLIQRIDQVKKIR